jgi:hypothetical protein
MGATDAVPATSALRAIPRRRIVGISEPASAWSSVKIADGMDRSL